MSFDRILFIAAVTALTLTSTSLVAQTKKEMIEGLEVRADSLRKALMQSEASTAHAQRERDLLAQQLDTTLKGASSREAALMKSLQQAQEQLTELQNNAANGPYSWVIPFKQALLDGCPNPEAGMRVLAFVDSLLNDHLLRLKAMGEEAEEQGDEVMGHEELFMDLYHQNSRFLYVESRTEGFDGATLESYSVVHIFHKETGGIVHPSKAFIPARREEMVKVLKVKYAQQLPSLIECVSTEIDIESDWVPSEYFLQHFKIDRTGVVFTGTILPDFERACEPEIALSKSEALPFFLQGLLD